MAEDVTAVADPLTAGGAKGPDYAQENMYDSLWGIEGPELTLRNSLARNWVLVGPKLMRVHLRDDIKFHNGDPLTAEDVHYTIEELRTNAKLGMTGRLGPISKVEVVDPYTVDLHFTPSGPMMFNLCCHYVKIVPKKHREEVGAKAYNYLPVGSGAYKFAASRAAEKIDFEANENYFLGKAFPDKLTMVWIRDSTTRAAALQSGTVNAAKAVPLESVPAIQKDANLQALRIKGAREIYTLINYTDPALKDVRLRKALNLAIDKSAIVDQLLEGYGGILASRWAPGRLGHDPDLEPYAYDPDKAKALIKEAGREGWEFEFQAVQGVFMKDTEIGQFMLNSWQEVGLKPKLRIIERATAFAVRKTLDFQVCFCFQWGTQFETSSDVNWSHLTPGADAGNALSDTAMGSEIKKLWTKQQVMLDPEKRGPILRTIDKYIHDNALAVFTHAQDEFWAVRKELNYNLYPNHASKSDNFYYDRWGLTGETPPVEGS
jgi:peptide/nickel transport system substrate-binding protein